MRSPTRRDTQTGIRRPRRDLNRYQPRHGKESWLALTTWQERAKLERLQGDPDRSLWVGYFIKLCYRYRIADRVYKGAGWAP